MVTETSHVPAWRKYIKVDGKIADGLNNGTPTRTQMGAEGQKGLKRKLDSGGKVTLKERKKMNKAGITNGSAVPTDANASSPDAAPNTSPVSTSPSSDTNTSSDSDTADDTQRSPALGRSSHTTERAIASIPATQVQTPSNPNILKEIDPTTFPNPSQDESLAPTNVKSLLYIYEHAIKKDDWKFQKSKQNWILKQLYNPECIPSKYEPSVLRYLATIQGSCRTRLQSQASEKSKKSNEESGEKNEMTERARNVHDILLVSTNG